VVRNIETGTEHTEYSPIGHSTSLAARLQTLATPGSIVISGNMRALVEGYFQLKGLGPTRIKGVSAPVELFEVTGLGPIADAAVTRRRARADEVRRARSRDRGAQACRRASKVGTRADRCRNGGAWRRQIAPVLRVQGEFAVGLAAARDHFGLVRQGLGLPASDRSATQLFQACRRR
jgi:hypothetical protein